MPHHKNIDYDSVSQVYDQIRTGDEEMVTQIVINLDKKITNALDIGCGTGNNTYLFEKLTNSRIVGVDLSGGMLRKALAKVPSLSFIQCPADKLPFAEASFDFVFMTEVLHHLPDASAVCSEIRRVLTEDGGVCIVTQSHEQIENRTTSRFFPDTIAIDQARYPTISHIEQILESVGFIDIISKSYVFEPIRLGDEFLVTVEKRGFSMLHKISDDTYKAGFEKIRQAMSDGERLDYEASYTFVWGYV